MPYTTYIVLRGYESTTVQESLTHLEEERGQGKEGRV